VGCAIPQTTTGTLIRPSWTIHFISVSTPPDNDMALPFLTHRLLRHDVIRRTRRVAQGIAPQSADYAALIRPAGACGSRQTVRVCRTPTHGRWLAHPGQHLRNGLGGKSSNLRFKRCDQPPLVTLHPPRTPDGRSAWSKCQRGDPV